MLTKAGDSEEEYGEINDNSDEESDEEDRLSLNELKARWKKEDEETKEKEKDGESAYSTEKKGTPPDQKANDDGRINKSSRRLRQ